MKMKETKIVNILGLNGLFGDEIYECNQFINRRERITSMGLEKWKHIISIVMVMITMPPSISVYVKSVCRC